MELKNNLTKNSKKNESTIENPKVKGTDSSKDKSEVPSIEFDKTNRKDLGQ